MWSLLGDCKSVWKQACRHYSRPNGYRLFVTGNNMFKFTFVHNVKNTSIQTFEGTDVPPLIFLYVLVFMLIKCMFHRCHLRSLWCMKQLGFFLRLFTLVLIANIIILLFVVADPCSHVGATCKQDWCCHSGYYIWGITIILNLNFDRMRFIFSQGFTQKWQFIMFFQSLSHIIDASMEDLARCPGIGERKV